MIKIVKLITGEELIGNVDRNSDFVIINKPCILQIVPSRNNPEQPMMALIPYASYCEKHRVTISLDKVIWEESPVQELYNQYNSIFGSGLVVPNSSNVVDFKKI